MHWDTQPYWTEFADLAAPPVAIPPAVQVPAREPMLHRDTRPPVQRGELTPQQIAWQQEKELNRHRKKLSRQYGLPWDVLMRLIGEPS